MDTSTTESRCPKCGAVLPKDAPLGVCPACLLAVAAEPASQLTDAASGDLTTAISSGAYSSEPARFAPGDTCGSYRIVGLLGRGGMGEVYEAVGADGRRVALKLLRQRLASQNDRERFLREGVLAASVTHPNCVYVYGSEEIEGLPVIAMELAPQGTLKQAIEQFGPRTPAQAVRDILQVVAGLEAAAAAGILHRDVKPSNCFIDADGGIKVGDFGLSMSLNPSEGDITWKPTFQGTPEFAAPEQLRGEPLDLRADIYSVGATLFFLLTGYSPFGERNIQKLILLKTKTPLPATSEFLPDIPKGLSALAGRCMSPDLNRRPQTYADLRELLLPFINDAPVPASMIRRLAASWLDTWVGAIAAPLLIAIRSSSWSQFDTIAMAAFSFLAYTIFDWRLGGTPGKLIVGIRVINLGGRRPTLGQAAARWSLCVGLFPIIALLQSAAVIRIDGTLMQILIPAAGLMTLFSAIAARFRSDNAMFHDLWTDTRVVRWNPAEAKRSEDPRSHERPQSLEVTPVDVGRVGPFEIIGRLRNTPDEDLLLARDARLRRFVWIHRHPNTPGVLPAVRRQLSQPTRLRWLAGEESWDAFEAPEGRAFAHEYSREGRSRDLGAARVWLSDLARDLEGAEAIGVVPHLSLDRLWVLSTGRIMLLDFDAPGVTPASGQPSESVPLFLAQLAEASGVADNAPMSNRLVIDALRQSWMTPRAAAALLQKLLHEPIRVNRWRRAFPILVCAVAPAVYAAGGWLEERAEMASFDRPGAEVRLLLDDLLADNVKGSSEFRNMMNGFAADSFRADIAANPNFWSTARGGEFNRYRSQIERTISWFRPLTAAETIAARDVAMSRLADKKQSAVDKWKWRNHGDRMTTLGMSMLMLLAPLAVGSILVSLVSTPFFLRVTNQSLFDVEGLDPNISRRVGRALVTWCPLLLTPLNVWLGLGVLAAGASYAIVSPERSIQDRIAGTFVAPR